MGDPRASDLIHLIVNACCFDNWRERYNAAINICKVMKTAAATERNTASTVSARTGTALIKLTSSMTVSVNIRCQCSRMLRLLN